MPPTGHARSPASAGAAACWSRRRVEAPVLILSGAAHAFPAAEPGQRRHAAPTIEELTPELGPAAGRTRIVERETAADAGTTLTGAAVVVSGGRGVGSADGFAILEELAGLLGGAVGCSRVVTNNGWRPHSDQVGQTGKRIAPELYIACGISGAIQHWVGMMAAKRVLAINTDRDAPMVTKADYAVIGDLHVVLPAVDRRAPPPTAGRRPRRLSNARLSAGLERETCGPGGRRTERGSRARTGDGGRGRAIGIAGPGVPRRVEGLRSEG